jgi:hypothetical protein
MCSPRRWRWWFLPLWSSVGCSFTLLGAADETLDEIHVLCNDSLINAMAVEVIEESNPRGVDAGRCETFLRIVAHVGDMNE